MEIANCLIVDAALTQATGTAEREAAAAMLGDLPAGGRITVGARKRYDTQDFVAEMHRLGVTPHVTSHTNGRRSAIDGRTTRHAGHTISLRIRKRIEEGFGWTKTAGGMALMAEASDPAAPDQCEILATRVKLVSVADRANYWSNSRD